jgi:hypothetical protein
MTGRAKLVLLVAVQQLFIHGAGFNFAKGFEIVIVQSNASEKQSGAQVNWENVEYF